MTTPAIEVGVFDMARLPVMWNNVEPDKLQAAVEVIDGTVEEQVQQLKERAKNASVEQQGTTDERRVSTD